MDKMDPMDRMDINPPPLLTKEGCPQGGVVLQQSNNP